VFAFLLSGCGGGDSKSGTSSSSSKAKASDNAIWHVGTKWDITVWQNSGDVSPDAQAAWFKSTYHFKVASKPKAASGTWKVFANLDGAEGLQARGFTLFYKQKLGAHQFDLTGVALRGGPPQPLQYADFVLGRDFPVDKHVTATPKSHKLVKRS
jgi:hypothetical protein